MNSDSFLSADKQPALSRGERRRARTRAEILEAARQIFARRGYHDASIAEITELAGIAVGTFYLYFRDKDEAFTTVLEEGFNGTRTEVIQVLAEQSGAPSLDLVVRTIFRHAYRQRDLFRVALMAGGQFARITRVQDAIEEVLIDVLMQTLTAQEQARYDLPLVARFLTGMVLQGIMWWFEQEQPDPDGMTNQLLTLLQQGLPAHSLTGDAKNESM
jgi:AcrR family transcriptional regulator